MQYMQFLDVLSLSVLARARSEGGAFARSAPTHIATHPSLTTP